MGNGESGKQVDGLELLCYSNVYALDGELFFNG
jgi:hypothetical protein